MSNKDTILIFREPELYFFPHYKDIIFQPLRISEKSFSYLVYKLLYILHIPQCAFFWGDWKEHLKTAKQVIIFDYGYQRGMENYIRKINPDCKVYLFMWNKIDSVHKNHTLFSDKSSIYSTDPQDCKKYHLKYNHMFYPMEYLNEDYFSDKQRLFFIGKDKNRGTKIQTLYHLLKESGIECDIRLLTSNKKPEYLTKIADILTNEPLPYYDYLKELTNCNILLDIVQSGQLALTMRVVESLFLSKKLITNNTDIKNYDFYNPNNMFILPDVWDSNLILQLKEFINKPYHPYSKELLSKYDFNHWLSTFDA